MDLILYREMLSGGADMGMGRVLIMVGVLLALTGCETEDLVNFNAALEEVNGVQYYDTSHVDDFPMDNFGYYRVYGGVINNQAYIRMQNKSNRTCTFGVQYDNGVSEEYVLRPGQMSGTTWVHPSVGGSTSWRC